MGECLVLIVIGLTIGAIVLMEVIDDVNRGEEDELSNMWC